MNGVHTGKLVEVRRQMRSGHQAGACKYTGVWALRGTDHLVFSTHSEDPQLPAGDERLLRVEWPAIATFETDALWMWA
jgi:hypothetical protein